MQRCNILDMNTSQYTNTMLYSRIQPDCYQKSNQRQYIIHKIPKADKKCFENYQIRGRIQHPHVLRTFIQQKSSFYHTIYIQKCNQFESKHLLMLPLNKRIIFLTQILSAVKVLAEVYGYFYITQKMMGYNSEGKITLWIHQNVMENKRSHPINHGKLSQNIFVSDFKAGFGGNLKELKQFQKTKTVDSLLALLSKNNNIAQSIYVSEPAHDKSNIYCRDSHIGASEIDFRDSCNLSDGGLERERFKFPSNFGLKRAESVNLLRNPISFSYIANQIEKSMIGSSKIMPIKTLSSSVSMQNLQHRRLQQESHFGDLNGSHKSINFSKTIKNSSSQKQLSKSILPKIQFTYQNANNNEIWKKKPNTFSRADASSSQSMVKSQSLGSAGFQAHQAFRQPLKVSFPHTTTHTFVPYSSNGNISLAFKDNINIQNAGKNNKQDRSQFDLQPEQHISEESNEVQVDLDNLFSDDEQLHSREEAEQLQMIMEELENVLLS